MFWRRAVLWMSLAQAACGRIAFDDRHPVRDGAAPNDADDATVDAAGAPTVPALIHMSSGSSGSSTITLSIPPTQPGNFVLVGVVAFGLESVTAVVDNAGNTYASANARAIITAGGASEIWFARNSKPNATQIDVTITGAGFEGWVAELSGVDAGPSAVNIASDQNSSATVVAPTVTTTSANALVVSVAGIVSGASGIHAGNPFTSLGIPNGDIASYFVASVPGSYGAVFDQNGSGLWCASTATFPAL